MSDSRFNYFVSASVFILLFFLFQIYALQIGSVNESEKVIADQSSANYYFPSSRGNIYDRNGEVLARTVVIPKLYLDTNLIDNDIEEYLLFLNHYLPEEDFSYLEEDAALKNKVIDIGLITNELYNVINLSSYDYPAFITIDFPFREYPYGELASHVLGYTGIPNQDDVRLFPVSDLHQIVGKNGVERQYELHLSGVPHLLTITKTNVKNYILGERGKDLYLTIETQLQSVVEESLVLGIDLANKNNTEFTDEIERGAAVVMNIKSGEVYSMASIPTFDPNQFISGISDSQFTQIQKEQAFNNFAIQGLYPPGSVFKVVPYWLSYNEYIYPEGISTFNEKYFAEECLSFQFTDGSQQVYCDWKKDGHGYVDYHEAIQKSVNVYFWEIALRIWRLYENSEQESILQDYARNLGFGEYTGIDLPYEKKGIVPDRAIFEEWSSTDPDRVREEGWLGGDLMNLIVGQGAITTTPLQVANAYASLIRGSLFEPSISSIKDPESIVRNDLDMEKDFSDMLLLDLGLVTNPGGTAYKSFSIMGDLIYDVGGKTGTAQTTIGKNSTSWFVGVDSIADPEYVVVVVIEEGGSGSAVAAPIARRIVQYLRGTELTSVEFGEVTE